MSNKYKPGSSRIDGVLSALVLVVALGFIGYSAIESLVSPYVA